MNENNLLIPEVGADFDEGLHQFRPGRRITESHRDLWETELDRVRKGDISPALFKEYLRNGFYHSTGLFQESEMRARETMTISDFPLMMIADSADRALLAGYAEAPATWMQYVRMKTNTDLKDADLFAVDGGEATLGLVNEQGPYPEAALSETKYSIRVKKRGRKFRFSLESWLNDGLMAFQSVPAKMGRAVRRTHEDVITRLYATDAQKAALFTVGNKNQIVVANGSRTANPAFSLDGVIDALTVMANQVDADGEPVDIQGATVVYPSSLEGVAMQIRNMLEARTTVRSGDASNTVVFRNFVQGMVNLVPNHRLRLVAETYPDAGWFMFANPSVGRPAFVAARLMGFEEPQLFMRSPDAVQIGGGAVSPMAGDFDNDSLAFKVRDWFNGITVDPKSMAYSTGQGS